MTDLTASAGNQAASVRDALKGDVPTGSLSDEQRALISDVVREALLEAERQKARPNPFFDLETLARTGETTKVTSYYPDKEPVTYLISVAHLKDAI